MGLEQRPELLGFDGPQKDFFISAYRRLTQFGPHLNRPVQRSIQGITTAALTLVGAHGITHPVAAEPLPQSTEITRLVTTENPTINPLTLELSNRVTQEIVKPLIDLGLDIDVTGELLTNAWVDEEGNRNIVYRNGWFQIGMDGQLKLVDALDWFNKKGLDEQLNFGLYGDPIPPKQDTEIEVGTEIKEFLQSLKQVLDIGPIVGYRNYGSFEVYRTGTIAFMRILTGDRTGQFVLVNTGLQLLATPSIPKEVVLSPLPFATGGGTTPTETPPQLGLILETLQTGKGKQTEWVIQKSPDSPITPVVQREDALNHVADTYLPRTGLKKVEIKFLPLFEGYIYNGLDFGSAGTDILLSDSIYGPTVKFKSAVVQSGDTLTIYHAVQDNRSLELMKSSADAQDKTNRGLSSYIGTLITEAGGYPREGAGRVAPEAWAMGYDVPTAAIRLVIS